MERDGKIALPYDKLATRIVENVSGITQPAAITDIGIDLRSGASVRNALARAKMKYPTVPGLFWDMVSKQACEALGAQCDKDMFQAVPEYYLVQSPDLVSEIWMRQEQLSNWVMFLAAFNAEERGDEARKRMAASVVKTIEETIKVPFTTTGETFQQYFGRVGYFNEVLETPLMQYSPDDLQNPQLVKPCEFDRLVHWARRARQILSIIQIPGIKPVYQTESAPSGCPMDVRGNNIPFIPQEPQRASFPPNLSSASFSHAMLNTTVYWIPREYLP